MTERPRSQKRKRGRIELEMKLELNKNKTDLEGEKCELEPLSRTGTYNPRARVPA